jgi:Protein of unknown function (DUF642)
MKLAAIYVSAAFASAAFISTNAGAANLATNGDFDNIGNVWTNNTGKGSNDWQTAGNVAIPGWSNVPGFANEFWVTSPNSYSGLTASPGNGSSFFVDLTGQDNNQPFGGLEQTIATTAGASYTLTFALGASTAWNLGSLAGSALTASATGSVLLASQLFTASTPSTDNQWTTETLSFVADSSSTTIEFLGDSTNVNSKYIGLDNVDVELATTPLPATLPLFAGGLSFVGYLTRRKKRAQAIAA